MNQNVVGVEYDKSRILTAQRILKEKNTSNVKFEQGDIENLELPHEMFDGIFCYSAIYFTDYRKTLKGFYSLLKPGGYLYFSTNDIGWYFYNILNNHNPSEDFSPSLMGMNAINNSIRYFSGGEYKKGEMILMPKEFVIDELLDMGFRINQTGADGKINVLGDGGGESFYEEYYSGFPMVYEILCEKTKA